MQSPTTEQQRIINKIANGYNVVVDAVAGSGKTTTILNTAKQLPDKKFLLLTYNRGLRAETNSRSTDEELKNIDVHTFHSFSYRYLHKSAFNDKGINQNLEADLSYGELPDIIIVDEAQDLTADYFRLVYKIFIDISLPQIVFFGDRYQNIYGFNKADPRYMKYAYEFFENDHEWEYCSMNTTFRCPPQVANFINDVFLGEKRLISGKPDNGKETKCYIGNMTTFADMNKTAKNIVSILKELHDAKIAARNIFILAPSIKSSRGMTARIENYMKTVIPDWLISARTNDNVRLNQRHIDKKICITTFHQAKGLERDYVFLLGADPTYFQFYAKNTRDKTICPNPIYVAATRAKKQLFLFHNSQMNFADFINEDKIEHKVYWDKPCKQKIRNQYSVSYSVSILLRHIHYSVIDYCLSLITVSQISDADRNIQIPYDVEFVQKETGEKYCEFVADIIGIAVNFAVERELTGKVETIEGNFWPHPKLSIKKNENLLKLANHWGAYVDGYKHRLEQIKKYDFVPENAWRECIKYVQQIDIAPEYAQFEKHAKCLIEGVTVSGAADIICGMTIYELKYTGGLDDEHILQLIIYAGLLSAELIPYPGENVYNRKLKKSGIVVTADAKTASMDDGEKWQTADLQVNLKLLSVKTGEQKNLFCENPHDVIAALIAEKKRNNELDLTDEEFIDYGMSLIMAPNEEED